MIGVNLLGKIETMSAFEFIAQKLFELHHKFQSEGLFCKLKRTDINKYMSHEKPSYFPWYWLVNRDPYDELL